MDNPLLFLLPVQPARDVHKTAGLGHNQSRGLSYFEITDLSLQPFCREFRVFNREDAAKATTIFRVGQLHKLCAFYVCQQCARLAVNVHATQGVTGWMIGNHSLPACA